MGGSLGERSSHRTMPPPSQMPHHEAAIGEVLEETR